MRHHLHLCTLLPLVLAVGCFDPEDYRPDPGPTGEGEGEGGEGEGEGLEGEGEGGTEGEGEGEGEGGGVAWYEKHVQPDPLVEPDCGSAKRQMEACEDWLVEEKREKGERWRFGACHVLEFPTNRSIPTTWACQLIGQYMSLEPAPDDQNQDHEWTFERMYEGRDCDDAEDYKPDCNTWLDLIRATLGDAITSATCTIEPHSPTHGANYCRLWGRIVYKGYPPKP